MIWGCFFVFLMKKYIIIAVIIVALIGSILSCWNKYQATIVENQRLQNNLEYYSNTDKENIVLQHTVSDLKNSKDSLVQAIDSVRGQAKIKPKTLKTVVYTETVIRDTLHDTIPVTTNFQATITPNNQTTIEIIRKDSSLTVIPDIRNSQTVFVHTKSTYKYSTFWKRLVHLNFSKKRQDVYTIDNSNSLIKTGETRVINIVN